MNNKTRSRRMLVVLPIAFIMLFSAIPALSMNVAAATASVSVSASVVCEGQQITVTAGFGSIYKRTPDGGNPNAELDDASLNLKCWYYPTSAGSYNAAHTVSGLGVHTVYLWYATGWDRIYGNYIYASKSTTYLVLSPAGDNDGDTMDNLWETTYGLNPLSAADKTTDKDGDGLLNYEEHNHATNTNPTLTDTDGDGADDHTEVHVWNTNPLGQDRWAVIVCGGDLGGLLQVDFENQADQAYDVLMSHGYTDQSIWYLNPNTGMTGVDDEATAAHVQSAIQGWLDVSDEDDKVIIYMVDHGEEDGDFVVQDNGVINPAQMGYWLATEQFLRLGFFIESCFSGAWIDDISGANRLVISSTFIDQFAYEGDPGWPLFSHPFWTSINGGNSVETAYAAANDIVQATRTNQDPMIDDRIAGNFFI